MNHDLNYAKTYMANDTQKEYLPPDLGAYLETANDYLHIDAFHEETTAQIALFPAVLLYHQAHPEANIQVRSINLDTGDRDPAYYNLDMVQRNFMRQAPQPNSIRIFIATVKSRRSYKEIFARLPSEQANLETLFSTGGFHFNRVYLDNNGIDFLLVTSRLGPESMFRLGAMMPYLLNRKDPGLDFGEILPLYQDLSAGKDDSYLTGLLNFCRKSMGDINIERRRRTWKALMDNVGERRLNYYQSERDQALSNVNEAERRYQAYLNAYREKAIALAGAQAGTETFEADKQEFLQYMDKNPYIEQIVKLDNTKVSLTIAIPCTNFDPEIIRQLIETKNVNTYFTRHAEAFRRIFLTEEFTLYLGSMLTVSFIDSDFKRSRNYQEARYSKGLPSPHFYVFDCWGMNKAPIMRALNDGNYIIAMTQLMSAAGNLNWTETTNMKELFEKAAAGRSPYDKPCVQVGENMLTWKQYLTAIEEGTI